MKRFLASLLFLSAMVADAAILRHDGAGLTFVASENKVSAFRGTTLLWSRPGLVTPTDLLLTGSGGVVVDALSQKLLWFEESGETSIQSIAFAPGEAVAVADAIVVVSRNDGSLNRFHRSANDASAAYGRLDIRTPAALLRVEEKQILSYDRISGRVVRIAADSFAVVSEMTVPPFAADLALTPRHAYLAYPRRGEVHVLDLAKEEVIERLRVGAVPTDIELTGNANAVTAGEMLVADPSSRKVWRDERTQSEAAAFARGFTRGLIGLGLYAPKSTPFPAGVDRVVRRAGKTFAFDSSSGILYGLAKKPKKLAGPIASTEFDVAPDGSLVYWDAIRQTVVELANR